MRWNKMKAVLAGAIFAVSVAVAGVNVQAATVVEEPEIVRVGRTVYCGGVTGLKINNKATKKFKKKIKTVKTGTNAQDEQYRTKAHFANDSDLYASQNAKDNEHGEQVYKYYPATANYDLTFLKAGTYKISYVRSVLESYRWNDEYDSATGKWVDIIEKYDQSNYEWKKVTNVTWVEAGVQAEEGFYQGANGTKYAYDESWNNYGWVPVSLAKAADGKTHVKYQSKKIEKVTHTKTYKVLNRGTEAVKSVKLGKTTQMDSTTYKEGGSTTSVKRGLLSGNSGKLVVTMADKNYKLTSILVRTYDANGKEIYTKVNNKKKVAYGNNIIKDEYVPTLPDDTYRRYRKTMYKPTDVLVFYQNKFTKESTTINSLTSDGAKITKTYVDKHPVTHKDVTLTKTYTYTKKVDSDGDIYFECVMTDQEFNYQTNKYENTTDNWTTDYIYFEGYGNYKPFYFYKK